MGFSVFVEMINLRIRAKSRAGAPAAAIYRVTIQVELDGGRSTTACHYAAASSEGALLVLAHGAGAGRSHPFMIAVADGLAARGIDVVTFDFPYMHERRHMPDRSPVLERCFVQVVARARALDDMALAEALRRRQVDGREDGYAPRRAWPARPSRDRRVRLSAPSAREGRPAPHGASTVGTLTCDRRTGGP